MATMNDALNTAVLQSTITKLNTKLTRQKNAVAETEQHILAIQQLINDKQKGNK